MNPVLPSALSVAHGPCELLRDRVAHVHVHNEQLRD